MKKKAKMLLVGSTAVTWLPSQVTLSFHYFIFMFLFGFHFIFVFFILFYCIIIFYFNYFRIFILFIRFIYSRSSLCFWNAYLHLPLPSWSQDHCSKPSWRTQVIRRLRLHSDILDRETVTQNAFVCNILAPPTRGKSCFALAPLATSTQHFQVIRSNIPLKIPFFQLCGMLHILQCEFEWIDW